jgi:hypothetical protein
MVQDLSPTDIENLAARYSAIEISVGKTPPNRSAQGANRSTACGA